VCIKENEQALFKEAYEKESGSDPRELDICAPVIEMVFVHHVHMYGSPPLVLFSSISTLSGSPLPFFFLFSSDNKENHSERGEIDQKLINENPGFCKIKHYKLG
jgi:hypothetical protein